MDTKALRQKILDLAIRGKLVPQDPNDEPASVLLDRIRAEKQQMVKDGKLKAKDIKNDTVIFKGEDNLHYEKFADGSVKCIEDKIPFELPEGWEWTRLGIISSSIQYGLSNSAEASGTHRILRITDIQDGKVMWENVPFTSVDDPTAYLLQKGDIVFARTGATVGKSFLIDKLPYESVYASYLIRIRLFENISAEYLYHFFNSYCYWRQITDKSVGVGQPNCNGTALKELFIPLPPTCEQLRILPAADSLLMHASSIELEKSSLKEILVQTKSKILDLAIRGKLVPQDPNDEPASVLLERIRAEKKELIKQGKIKRDKNESVIFKGEDNSYYEKIGDTVRCIDDEVPFELPENWIWCRLKNISDIVMGASPSGNNINNDSQYIEFHQGKIFFSDLFINKSGQYTKEVIKTALPNSVLLCVRAPVGEVNITDRLICIGRGLAAIKPLDSISEYFILYWLCAFKTVINEKATGTTFKAVTSDVVREILIPLPPLSNQKRIIDQIQNAVKSIDQIEKSLS
ncbi:MAG: restriction endonuclease subunit S [Ruminococcaceae bacterium]|nr:restriction endonuclease subunit S [Oscillospiraceae bacterium]